MYHMLNTTYYIAYKIYHILYAIYHIYIYIPWIRIKFMFTSPPGASRRLEVNDTAPLSSSYTCNKLVSLKQIRGLKKSRALKWTANTRALFVGSVIKKDPQSMEACRSM